MDAILKFLEFREAQRNFATGLLVRKRPLAAPAQQLTCRFPPTRGVAADFRWRLPGLA